MNYVKYKNMKICNLYDFGHKFYYDSAMKDDS